ncbi:MAG: hypothetical protein L6Q98_12625 [Anaerolineae bacterium]|nr:hypothetical protein [Anaerolineae bacterium]NUQ04617.1 hypothetical protein [Anaerolineae bacterium]
MRDEVTMDIDPTPTPSPTLILIDGIYRATQTVGDPRVYIERDMAAGIDPFDSDPVDGWTTIGRSNGAGNNGPLRAFTVIDDVPYAAMENAQRECVVVTPTSLRPRTANQTRTVKIAEKGNPARCAGDWAGFAP